MGVEMMEIEQIIISAFITIFSIGLFLISIASYRKYNNKKLLMVSGVFFLFLVKGILLSYALFFNDPLGVTSVTTTGLFDVLILILLFIATLKR